MYTHKLHTRTSQLAFTTSLKEFAEDYAPFKTCLILNMMAHACNPSVWEAEAGGTSV